MAALVTIPILGGCGASCPAGTARAASGACIDARMAAYVECVNATNARTTSHQESLNATVGVEGAKATLDKTSQDHDDFKGTPEKDHAHDIDRCRDVVMGGAAPAKP
jgi:hypothetical protein